MLRAGTVSTNVYLRRLQNHALDMTKATVLVLNRNWQAINVRTPQEGLWPRLRF